jgi:hypothetical protein
MNWGLFGAPRHPLAVRVHEWVSSEISLNRFRPPSRFGVKIKQILDEMNEKKILSDNGQPEGILKFSEQRRAGRSSAAQKVFLPSGTFRVNRPVKIKDFRMGAEIPF